MKRSGLLIAFVVLGLMALGGVHAAEALTALEFDLVPASDAVAGCAPEARAHVIVLLKEDTRGVDTLHLSAEGLPGHTDFAVFLTSADAFAAPAFGATQYIGDFTTNSAGRGSLKVEAIIAEAFVTTVANGARTRADLDHLVFWFADPTQAQHTCGLTNTTGFDGDRHAGPAAMSSRDATGLEQFPN